MIVPMKKYTFLIHHRDYQPFLESLQDLGMVDVADKGVELDKETNAEIQRISRYKKVIRILESHHHQEDDQTTDMLPDAISDIILNMDAEIESARQKMSALEKAYRVLRPWGDFSKELLEKLDKQGLHVRFFAVSDKRFRADWPKKYNLEVISQTDGQTYFVIIQQGDETIDIDAEEVKAPERPASQVREEKEALEARIEEIREFYRENTTAFLPVLEKAKIETENRISFEYVMSNTQREAEDKLMVLQGWVPRPRQQQVEKFLEEKNIYFMAEKPVKGEKVPILLTNNKYSRLFEPIGKLYSLPSYRELDLTPFFAPFFMLFFGFCLGDAGYGILFVLGATLLKPRVKPPMKRILTLMQWLGSSTIIFGIISGTFFGINLIELADTGKIAWLSSLRGFMLDSSKMFNFALILGAIQIVYGMGIKAANITRQYGFRYAVSTIGWLILIVGGVIIFALSKNINPGLVKTLVYILLGISGLMILFLNNPDKNALINLGGGLWDVYSIVTGVLGDLLSYIRLFALGVSSAILGYVFNDLAMQMSGNIPVLSQIIFVVILLIGHGLNIFMASLGAFVHPMRLTFVEFYKNAGFTGGGKPYSPFRKKSPESSNQELNF